MSMRRLLALLCLSTLAAAASGCSGADATEAQALLAKSDAAFAQVRSATFMAHLTMTGGSEEVGMTMTGGGYVRGKRAGDFYVVATAENLPFGELAVTSRSGRVSMALDGSPIASVPAPPTQDENPLAVAEFSQYVKDVKVEHGKLIGGQAMAKISGTIDTAGLAKGVLGDVAGGSGLDLSDSLEDTRVVLYISEASQLPMRCLIDMGLDVAGQKVEMHLDFAYTSYNERVEFP
jgi:hypothetical protein